MMKTSYQDNNQIFNLGLPQNHSRIHTTHNKNWLNRTLVYGLHSKPQKSKIACPSTEVPGETKGKPLSAQMHNAQKRAAGQAGEMPSNEACRGCKTRR